MYDSKYGSLFKFNFIKKILSHFIKIKMLKNLFGVFLLVIKYKIIKFVETMLLLYDKISK
jgi:hypothetical protein